MEAARRHEEEDMVFYTVSVDEHKTGKSERAKLVLDKNLFRLLKRWMKVREALLPPSCPYVFPNYGGERLADLTALINKFASRKGFRLPTSRVVRSAIEVQATCLPPAEKQAIARSMSHSHDTAEKHYRALDQGKTMLAYKSVGSLLGVPVQVQTTSTPSTSTPKRRFYTPQETTLVTAAFERHVAQKCMPTMEEAQAFLAQQVLKGLFVGRKPHDIYDKVRNLIGRKQLKH